MASIVKFFMIFKFELIFPLIIAEGAFNDPLANATNGYIVFSLF